MVQTKKSSIDGLPIQRVVKKEKKNKKTMPVKEDVKPLKKVKTEKAFSIPELNDQSISTDDWENNLKWEKSVKCRQVLEALVSDVEPRRRRKQQLTKTQVWPFVGNPTVKRIITGVSKEPYDPLSKVDPDRKYWTSLSLIYKFLLCYPILFFLNSLVCKSYSLFFFFVGKRTSPVLLT